MSHTRKPFQWDNYASSTAVSDDGCVGMRANVDGSGLEVSYDGAAWTAFSGGGGSPAGTGTELQYRNAGAFGAVAGSSNVSGDVTFSNSGGARTFALQTWGTSAPAMRFITARDVSGSPDRTGVDDQLGVIDFFGNADASDTLTSFERGARIHAVAVDNWDDGTLVWATDLVFSTKRSSLAIRVAGRFTADQRFGVGDNIAHGDVLARMHVKTGTADLVGFRLDAPTSGSADIAAIYNQASTKVVYVSSTGTLFTTPTAGVAGINVGSLAGDPSSLGNGDIWYSTSANALRARVNGTTVSLSTSAPRLDEIANPAASKTFTMSAGGTDYPLIFSWDSTTGATNLFTLETAAGTGTGAMLLIKPLGGQEALVVNNGANQFVLGEGGEIDTNGLLTIRAASGLGIRLFDGATNNVYLQYVGATPALRVIYNGGPAESLVTEPGTQTLTNKTLSTATSVTAAIAWADGVTQTFNPNGTSAGINVGSHTADPSALNNGDVWYNSTGNVLNARINGATVSLGAGGGGSPGGSGSEIQYRSGASTFGAVSGSSVSGSSVTLAGDATTSFTVQVFAAAASSIIGVSRGRGTIASPTAVQSSDQLGSIIFGGQYSSTVGQITTSSAIIAEAQANFTATNNAPTDLILYTKNNTIGVHAGIRLTSEQRVGIGDDITHAQVTHGLTVLGTTKVVSNSINAIEVDSSGRVGFGHLDTGYDFTFGTLGRNDVSIQGHTTSNSVFGAVLSLEKSEGTVLGSPANVDATSFVSGIRWRAYRDGAYQTLAQMLAFTGNSFGASNYEGILRWAVTKNGDTIPTDTLTMTGGRITIGSAADPVGVLDVYGVGSSTAVVDTLTIKDYQTSGTAAAGFGAAELWKLESSTTASQNAAQVETHWQDATHATRGAVHRIKTVANASALLGRQILGCFKTIPDNTETALFSIVFGTTDHTAVNGYVQFTFIAKQVTGSVQTQTYHKVIPFSAYHNGSTNTGAAVWGTETLTAALTSTGGITFTGGSLGFKVNSTISPTPATGFNTATFQVQIDSDLTTISELSCYYNIFYTGQSEITLA